MNRYHSRTIILGLGLFLLLSCSDGPDDNMAAQVCKPDWHQLKLHTRPDCRYFHTMAYDSHRHVVILFGGNDQQSHRLGDTWEFSSGWKKIVTDHSPSPRWKAAMAYDPIRKKTVLFGGNDTHCFNDTWEYDGNDWTKIEPSQKPSPRNDHGLTFDWNVRCIIMIGGSTTNYPADSWKYDGLTWTELDFCRSKDIYYGEGCRLAFDHHRGVTVLYGGGAGPAVFDDTWEFDGICWQRVRTDRNPGPLMWYAMAYSPTLKKIVLYGGGHSWSDETFTFDGSTWREIQTANNPGRRATHSMVYNDVKNYVLMFGGESPNLYPPDNETWIFQ